MLAITKLNFHNSLIQFSRSQTYASLKKSVLMTSHKQTWCSKSSRLIQIKKLIWMSSIYQRHISAGFRIYLNWAATSIAIMYSGAVDHFRAIISHKKIILAPAKTNSIYHYQTAPKSRKITIQLKSSQEDWAFKAVLRNKENIGRT